MSGQQAPLNQVPNKPTLADLMSLLKKEIFLDMNCCHVGTVQSFDSAKQTVYATVNYQKTFKQFNTATSLYQTVQVAYPTLVTCPLIMLGGGATNLTFPVAKGDECLLLFNDRDIDNWWAGGTKTQSPGTGRLHSFSDAFALVGVKSSPNALTAYDTARAILTNGNVSVGINPSSNKATIKNNTVGTLNSVLQNILTQLQTLANTTVTSGATPLNPGVATQLSTLATQLGNLLE